MARATPDEPGASPRQTGANATLEQIIGRAIIGEDADELGVHDPSGQVDHLTIVGRAAAAEVAPVISRTPRRGLVLAASIVGAVLVAGALFGGGVALGSNLPGSGHAQGQRQEQAGGPNGEGMREGMRDKMHDKMHEMRNDMKCNDMKSNDMNRGGGAPEAPMPGGGETMQPTPAAPQH